MSSSPPPPPPSRRGRALRVARRAAIDLTPLRHEHFRRLWTGNSVAYVGFPSPPSRCPVQVYDVTRFVVLGRHARRGRAGTADRLRALGRRDRGRRRPAPAAHHVVARAVGLHPGAPPAGARRLSRTWRCSSLLVAVQSAAFAVASSTRGAVLPRVLPAVDIASANTLNFTASTAAAAVGPLLAGPLVDRHSFAAAYGVDAVLFTLALYAALRLPSLPPLRSRSASSPGHGAGHRQAQGPRACDLWPRGSPSSRPARCCCSRSGSTSSRWSSRCRSALFPQAAAERFGGRGGRLAVRRDRARLVDRGPVVRVDPPRAPPGRGARRRVVAWGLAIAASGLARSLSVAVLLLVVGGAADLVSAVYRQTILQTYAPDELRGRLQGVFIVVVAGGPRLGDLRAGAAAAVVRAAGGVGRRRHRLRLIVLRPLLVPAFRRLRRPPVLELPVPPLDPSTARPPRLVHWRFGANAARCARAQRVDGRPSGRARRSGSRRAPTWPGLRAAAPACRGCELWEPASQVVFSAGDPAARVALVGEQPGRRRGPRGDPLRRARRQAAPARVDDAGIDRGAHLRDQRRQALPLHPAGQSPDPLRPPSWRTSPPAGRGSSPSCGSSTRRSSSLLGATAAKSLLGPTSGSRGTAAR